MTKTAKEEWKDIESCKGYQVSDRGRVRSKTRMVLNMGRVRIKPGEILTPQESDEGYWYVRVKPQEKGLAFRVGKTVKKYVHRLVAEAWHGNPFEGAEADHIDRDRSNNTPENLRWVTRQENADNRVLNPNKGSASNLSKLNEEDVRLIRKELGAGAKASDLATKYDVNVSTIRRINNGQLWAHLDGASEQGS